MRYATFSTAGDGRRRLGAVIGGRMVDAAALARDHWSGSAPPPATLLDLVEAGPDAWRQLDALVARAGANARSHALADIQWHAPLPRPRKNVFCVGRNYAAHVREGAAAHGREARLPTVPVFFTKAPTAVTGPYDDVPRHAAVTGQLDWEAELAVVIGRAGRDVERREALQMVFGYTALNDVTARDLQSAHTQWFKGKSLDGSCPMGPVLVTADEFGDPQRKRIRCRVNGVLKQEASTADMIFPVAAIIESLSRGLTLEPGDVIATGTPDGVGMGRTPPEYLQAGDIVETEVEGIGILRNRIAAP